MTLYAIGRTSIFRRTALAMLGALSLAVGELSTASVARAADTADQIKAYLAAGEFGPATELADRQTDAATRDQLLREIAVAQKAGGAAAGATKTLTAIKDDQVRAKAVNDILAQRVGAPDPIFAQLGGGGGGLGAGGGGNVNNGMGVADFEPLIDLIKTTIEPESWEDAGGTGAIKEFTGGVMVDTSGVMRRIVQTGGDSELDAVHRAALASGGNADAHREAPLRKVSLTRLEKAIQMLRASGHNPDESMKMLAGLQRIQYVLVYPDTGDIVLAGPAGDWRRAAEGRVVSVENGHPVLQLDDLVVMLRHTLAERQARFGCSIDPIAENMARTQQFVAESAKHPLAEGRQAREDFVAAIRHNMGKQKIEVFGIDPRSRVGHVLVEADYRMKLVGLGLEPGAGDLRSYLDLLRAAGNNAPQSLDVLRWWFTLNYDAIQATPDRTAFAIRGQGVKLQSTNEMLADQGRRVQTGKADELNSKFAASFTRNFPALAAKYPIYAELQNVFDLALAAALIASEDLSGKVDWHMSGLRSDAQYQVALAPAPTMVDSVVNYRIAGEGRLIVQVSGGVKVETANLVSRDHMQTVKDGAVVSEHSQSKPRAAVDAAWWWD